MSHLDICSPSYGQEKGRKSNWQFDSRPLKVRNRPESDVIRQSATWRWKALEEGYKFGSDLVPIRGRGKKLWSPKVPGVQIGTVSGLHFGSPGKKVPFECSLCGRTQRILYGGRWWLPLSLGCSESSDVMLLVACPKTKCVPGGELTHFVVSFVQDASE
jgi:hypothetical protein